MDSQIQVQEPLLSIVAIGRNEARNIEKLSTSISSLTNKLRPYTQTIFVDSASTDDTYKLATESFDEVYILEESPWLCAAAGRALGTLKARGKWILYLDGDTELCREFADIAEELLNRDENISGYIGRSIYIFPDGTSRQNTFGCQKEGDMASEISGQGLLLRREDVLKAGNWDPSVFSNEEMELYSRLPRGECSIRYLDVPLVLHHTPRFDRLHTLLRLLHPSFGLGKKWYGLGQVLAARMRTHRLYSFVKLEPYPFVYWGGLFLGSACALAGSLMVGASVVMGTLTFILVKRGWKSLVIHCTQILPALVGWTKYNPEYSPKVLTTFRRPASNPSIPGIAFHEPTRL